jgi:hypothetical protein
MTETTVVEVNRARDRGDGQLVDLEVTLADGSHQVIAFAYAKVAVAVRGLLVGHLAAALARKAAGTLDLREHAASFALRRVTMDLLPPSHAGLALTFDDDAILPVQLDGASARKLGLELLEAASRLEEPHPVHH